MKLFGLLALMIAGIAPAWAVNYVYVYGDGRNTSYQCRIGRFYVEPEQPGSLYADQCQILGYDTTVWPLFVPAGIHLDMAGKATDVEADCFFVAHAVRGNDSSTVIDCRQ